MSDNDSFNEEVIRIQQDHNVSEQEAVRVAYIMERFIDRKAAKETRP